MASYWPDFPSFKAKIEVGGVGSLKQRRNRVKIPFKFYRLVTMKGAFAIPK